MTCAKELSRLLKEVTILYAEDEPTIREDIYELLSLFSQDVIVAKDGEEALNLYNEKKPHIIVTDIVMPKMNGISLAKKIRENDLTIPIIFLTAYTDEHYLFSAANLNIQAYIVKPLDYKKIKEVLFQVVDFLNLTTNIYTHITDKLSYDKVAGILLYHENEEIKLNKKEKALMDLLVEHKSGIVTYDEIENYVWDNNNETMTHTALRTIVKNLRKKSPVDFIENVSGQGYKIHAQL